MFVKFTREVYPFHTLFTFLPFHFFNFDCSTEHRLTLHVVFANYPRCIRKLSTLYSQTIHVVFANYPRDVGRSSACSPHLFHVTKLTKNPRIAQANWQLFHPKREFFGGAVLAFSYCNIAILHIALRNLVCEVEKRVIYSIN